MSLRVRAHTWCPRITAVAALCGFVGCVLTLHSTPVISPALPLDTQPAVDDTLSDTIFAIGDLHGDLAQAEAALELVGLTDSSGNWQGGSSTLVQTGDLLDRGPDSLALVQLFEGLKVGNELYSAQGLLKDRKQCFLVAEQDSANISGGKVFTLLGNHEVMNLMGDYRYVNPAELTALAEHKQINGISSNKDKTSNGLAVWQQHMQQDSLVGKALRRRDAATIVGKGLCKTLFIHAGLSPLMLKALLRQSGSSISAAHHLDTLNALIADAVAACSTVGSQCTPDKASLITDADSVVWYRGYVHHYEKQLCPQVDQVLQGMQVQRIVAGHNVMSDGRIKALCGGKVNLIDVGISRAYLGNMAVWTCSKDIAMAVHLRGRRFRLPLTDAIKRTTSQNLNEFVN